MKEITIKAHGRVNLIGEHTDYNEGWVLPTSIPQFTKVTLTPLENKKAHIISSSDVHQGKREVIYEIGKEVHSGTWMDYLQGATKILGEQFELKGFGAQIHSTIPEGSGLSSSAALEMSFLKALREYHNLPIEEKDLARIGQRIENEFVGARVGIMDQMATSLATTGEALYLDTKTLDYERVTLPLDHFDLLVINSGISHRLSAHDGGYNQRRKECEEICRILGKSLRDTALEEVELKSLPENLLKRARHVITENQRVHDAVKAIKEKDISKLGELFYLSHESMKNEYEVSIPEIDILVSLLAQNQNVYGARLTGGGFGGSVVALTLKGKKHDVANEVIPLYERQTGGKGTVLV